jgi:hypothetical protein
LDFDVFVYWFYVNGMVHQNAQNNQSATSPHDIHDEWLKRCVTPNPGDWTGVFARSTDVSCPGLAVTSK